jgi:hypothetical protein
LSPLIDLVSSSAATLFHWEMLSISSRENFPPVPAHPALLVKLGSALRNSSELISTQIARAALAYVVWRGVPPRAMTCIRGRGGKEPCVVLVAGTDMFVGVTCIEVSVTCIEVSVGTAGVDASPEKERRSSTAARTSTAATLAPISQVIRERGCTANFYAIVAAVTI